MAVADTRDKGASAEAGQQDAVNDGPPASWSRTRSGSRAGMGMLDSPNRVGCRISTLASDEIALKRMPSWTAVVIRSRGRGEERNRHLERRTALNGKPLNAANAKAVTGPATAKSHRPGPGPRFEQRCNPPTSASLRGYIALFQDVPDGGIQGWIIEGEKRIRSRSPVPATAMD